jgi:hypothetical protein
LLAGVGPHVMVPAEHQPQQQRGSQVGGGYVLPAEGLGPAAAAAAADAAHGPHGVQEAVEARISVAPAASAAARSEGGQHIPVKDGQQ